MRERIFILHNVDFDTEHAAHASQPDATSVELSASAVAAALVESGYQVELIGIHGAEANDVLHKIRHQKPDLVFNLCESMAGHQKNEPTFAGLLDLFQIPYTGADLLALATCLHKHRTKHVLFAHNVPTPPAHLLRDETALANPILDTLDYPWFLKLAHADASLGITEENIVTTPESLREVARKLMRKYNQPVLAERYIHGREVCVTLIGHGDDIEILPLHEMDFSNVPPHRPHVITYASKWDESHIDYNCMGSIPIRETHPTLIAHIKHIAKAAYQAVELRDYGRIDIRIDRANQPWVIDVNPNPDLAPDGGFARAGAAQGMPYPPLIDKLTQLALQRIRRQGRAAASSSS